MARSSRTARFVVARSRHRPGPETGRSRHLPGPTGAVRIPAWSAYERRGGSTAGRAGGDLSRRPAASGQRCARSSTALDHQAAGAAHRPWSRRRRGSRRRRATTPAMPPGTVAMRRLELLGRHRRRGRERRGDRRPRGQRPERDPGRRQQVELAAVPRPQRLGWLHPPVVSDLGTVDDDLGVRRLADQDPRAEPAVVPPSAEASGPRAAAGPIDGQAGFLRRLPGGGPPSRSQLGRFMPVPRSPAAAAATSRPGLPSRREHPRAGRERGGEAAAKEEHFDSVRRAPKPVPRSRRAGPWASRSARRSV